MEILTEQTENWYHFIEAQVSRCFDVMVAIIFCGSRPLRSDYERARRRALAIAKPTSEGLLTTPEHDQPDHEGLFSCKQTKNKEENEIAIWILRI